MLCVCDIPGSEDESRAYGCSLLHLGNPYLCLGITNYSAASINGTPSSMEVLEYIASLHNRRSSIH